MHRFGRDYTLQRLEIILERRKCLVQMREKESSLETFKDLAKSLIPVCRKYGTLTLANADHNLARRLGFDGVHLSSTRLRAMKTRPGPEGFWVGASCHDLNEIRVAEQLGADFAVLAPVLPTKSHTPAHPMGWSKFEELCSHARIPVYALGGMDFNDLTRARTNGAQGVAMISSAWKERQT